MLASGDSRGRVVVASAERLPFADASFDGLTFTYLLRYVDDPAATLCELARVVRPGGAIASLEFHMPRSLPLRAGWSLYTRLVLPVLGAIVSRDWAGVARFLPSSIRRFYAQRSLREVEQLWRGAGIEGVASAV
ncbi:MAG: methyltransferase domain-containing protein, partial [Chloroflexi bacterium]